MALAVAEPAATARELIPRIERLRRQRNAVILAHNYQLPEVQDIADFVGDSLNLSRQAAETDADVIVSLDGKAITSADQLGADIQAYKPGQTVEVGLYRGRVRRTITATLGSTSEEPQSVG